MTTNGFQLGDVVLLKSGSPIMTVVKTKGVNTVIVGWFGADGFYRKENFSVAALEKYDDRVKADAAKRENFIKENKKLIVETAVKHHQWPKPQE